MVRRRGQLAGAREHLAAVYADWGAYYPGELGGPWRDMAARLAVGEPVVVHAFEVIDFLLAATVAEWTAANGEHVLVAADGTITPYEYPGRPALPPSPS